MIRAGKVSNKDKELIGADDPNNVWCMEGGKNGDHVGEVNVLGV